MTETPVFQSIQALETEYHLVQRLAIAPRVKSAKLIAEALANERRKIWEAAAEVAENAGGRTCGSCRDAVATALRLHGAKESSVI